MQRPGGTHEDFRLFPALQIGDPQHPQGTCLVDGLPRLRMKVGDDQVGVAPVVLLQQVALLGLLHDDAVRPAEPQPAFPQSIQKLFDSTVIFAGNPSLLSLDGVRVLAYHGRSMDDLVSAIPGMSYHRPIDGMKAMLRMRHLAPIYGGKTPIAPEAEDHLIIDEVPDIFVTGHVHAVGVDQYRGVVLVNASTWQAQTPYQKMRNIEPMPARLPIVDLSTGAAIIREF